MFQANTNNQSFDSDCNSLGTGLLVTASSSGKYARLWRLSITVGVLVSLKKRTCLPGEGLSPSPKASSPLTQENESDSLSENPMPGQGFSSFVSKVYNSFSSISFKDEGASSSTSSYVHLPSSPVDQGITGTPSSQSRHAIDIPSDIEEEDNSNNDQLLRNTVDQIMKGRDLNLLQEFGGFEKVASAFGSHLEHGIPGVQDQKLLTWSAYKTKHAKGFFFFLLKAGTDLNILFLLVAAALSFVSGTMVQGPKYGWHDGVAILAAVFMLLTIPSVTDFRRHRKLEKGMWEKKNKLEVKVVRNGQEHLIGITNLKEGDLVQLVKGDQVPGDGLVVKSYGLGSDEVLNSEIDCDRNPFLFYGSKVKEGRGTMLVTSVGGNTALGKVMSSVSQDSDEKMLLEAQTQKPNALMENLSLFVSMVIAVVAFIRFLHRRHMGDGNELPDLKGKVSVGMVLEIFERVLFKPQGKISILVSALTVVAIAIQHGMPFVITISLSYWNDVLINQAKPQNLSAFATMGVVSVICIDATGGFLCDSIEISKFCIGEEDVNNDAASEINQDVLQALERGIGASVLVPEISVWPKNDWLVSWAKSRSLNVDFENRNLSIKKCGKLSSDKKVRWVLMKNESGDEEKIMHLHWSGGASTILDMCSHYYDSKGGRRAIKDEKRKFQELVKDMEDSGLRPIAFACSQTEVDEIKEDGLHLLALAGLRHRCPDEPKSAIGALMNLGVRIILVSEDELSALRTTARDLIGTFRPESNDMAIEAEQAQNSTKMMSLRGSCLAEDKLLLVQSEQKKGHVVAFFGGSSTRDTPALKKADVGITECNRCTEMARESSDIVITSTGSLPLILKPGRCAYRNIQKFTQLQLTGCISGLLITLITTLRLNESPLTSVQLMWVYWIMYTLGGLMMRMDFKDHEATTNSPAMGTKSLLDKVMWKHIAVQVLCQVFVLLIFQFKGQVIPSINEDVQKAMIFNSFTLCQVFNQFNAMQIVKKEVFSVVVRNYTFLVALVMVIVVQVLIIEFATSLAGYKRLNGMQWGVCFVLATLPWGIHSAMKFISDSFTSMSSLSNGLRLNHLRRQQHWLIISFLGIPLTMFLLYSTSGYYIPGISSTVG